MSKDDLGEPRAARASTLPGQERPILFSGPMVRAILDGRKTQTRCYRSNQEEKMRKQFKTIQDPGSVRHEWNQEERYKDLIRDKAGVRCEVLISKTQVVLKTKDWPDYFLAKSVIRGRVALDICRDVSGLKEA